MIISIASGKGGTGKTTVATSLALSLGQDVQLLDCDVEEPNSYIFLKPEFSDKRSATIPVPKIDDSKCTLCGKCAQVCAYNALAVVKTTVLTFSQLCHGCGGCSLLCPQGAITEVEREIGIVESGTAGKVEFIHGKLNIGEAMAPPLIKEVKEYIKPNKITIIDAPPGTSCPVITAIKGSDFCVLVTEPTPFGLNDLVLAVEVLRKLEIKFGVVINRSDMGDKKVKEYCDKEDISILMSIPFKKEIAFAYSKGEPVVKAFPEYKDEFVKLYDEILKIAQ